MKSAVRPFSFFLPSSLGDKGNRKVMLSPPLLGSSSGEIEKHLLFLFFLLFVVIDVGADHP